MASITIKLAAAMVATGTLTACALTGDYVAPTDGPIATIQFSNQTESHNGIFRTYEGSETCTGELWILRQAQDGASPIHLLRGVESEELAFVGDRSHAFRVSFAAVRRNTDVVGVPDPSSPLGGEVYGVQNNQILGACTALFSFHLESGSDYQVTFSDPSPSNDSNSCEVYVQRIEADGSKVEVQHHNRVFDPNPHDANSPHCMPL